MPKLQIALDFTDLEKALEMAKIVAPYCDILEAGTPLIKSVGLEAVRQLKKNFPKKLIFADMKTVDVASLEVEMAARTGANFISVLGISSDTSVKTALISAQRLSCEIVFDLMGVYDKVKRAKELEALNAKYLHIHTGLDEQKEGKTPFLDLKNLAENTHIQLTVAGGINKTNIGQVLKIPRLEIIMVGGAVTASSNPEQEVLELHKILWNTTDS